jgi:lipoyl-dependent peroxiredoxin
MGIGHEIDRVRLGVVTTSSRHRPCVHRQHNFFQQEYNMNRPEKVTYTAKVHTTGGRVGSSRSDDGKLDVKLTRPGTSGAGTNPEQLFAAGWSACYQSAMELVARRMKVALPADFAVDAEVDLGPNGAGYDVAVRLNVSLRGIAPDVAQRLIETTHEVCPYSRATHGNIAVETKLA